VVKVRKVEAKVKLRDRLFLKKEEKLQEGRKRWQRKDEKLEDVVKVVTAYTLPPISTQGSRRQGGIYLQAWLAECGRRGEGLFLRA
jgi:hypothetical protein